jgi:putative PIN family toxin of toxin-antitoxin system
MRVFVDSNIIVSAVLFPKSSAAKALNLAIQNHTMILSSYVLWELEKVFLRKFPDNWLDLEKFLRRVKYETIELKKIDHRKYPALRDKNDVPILAAAIESGADILLTGDKDFFAVKISKPLIIAPADFVRKYSSF